jgi:hypothetical protein
VVEINARLSTGRMKYVATRAVVVQLFQTVVGQWLVIVVQLIDEQFCAVE